MLHQMVAGACLQIVPWSSISTDLDVLLSDLAMCGDGLLPGAKLLANLEAELVLGVPLHLVRSKFAWIHAWSIIYTLVWNFELHRILVANQIEHFFVGSVCLRRKLFPPILVHICEGPSLQRNLYAPECSDHSNIIYTLPAWRTPYWKICFNVILALR